MKEIFSNIEHKTIGLLGGSFNPPHQGHLQASLEAIKHLKLDQVWWLVSPGNPLKDNETLPDINSRLKLSEELTRNHPIIATNIEDQMGTIYTFDTLKCLKKEAPKTKFIWLMGEDNLKNFNKWKKWEEIIKTTRVAILKRPGFSQDAKKIEMASIFSDFNVPSHNIGSLKNIDPPAWGVIPNRLNDSSSTKIRGGEIK